jgi:hypothetical protein
MLISAVPAHVPLDVHAAAVNVELFTVYFKPADPEPIHTFKGYAMTEENVVQVLALSEKVSIITDAVPLPYKF